jgi:protocatechuate 3,4-dioxygenase beta subunit
MRTTVALLTVSACLAASTGRAQAPAPPPPPTGTGAGVTGQVRPGAAQPPSRQKPQTTGTGIMRGRVFSADTNGPLRRARLLLTSPDLPQSRATATDADGRFEFKTLPAGRYKLTASKAGYVSLEYGQRRAREPGKPIDLGERQTLEKVDITLPKGCAIGGRVVDDLGEVNDQVRVVAMRMQYFEGRRRPVNVSNPAEVDDLGQYRISGLAPGAYYLGTLVLGGGGANDKSVYAQTYYPGTMSMGDAEPITVRVGQERLDANFALVASRPLKVSGLAVDSGGRPVAGASVNIILSARGPSMMMASMRGRATTQPDGSFAIENLSPGEQTIAVATTNAQTGQAESASVELNLVADDINNLVLTTMPAITVTGRIRFEPEVADPGFSPDDIGVYADSSAMSFGLGGARYSSTVRRDWTLELKNLPPGRRRLAVRGLPSGWAVKAILFDRRDVTDTPLAVKDTEDLNALEVVLTNRLTELSGTVTDGKDQAVEYSVVAFSEDSAKWMDKSRFVAAVRPDQTGRFTVRALPPGDYLVVALDYLEEGDSNDPDFLEKLRSRATKITLGEGEAKTIELKLITEPPSAL